MDTKVLDRILATDDKIRYACILSNDFKSLESKAREDVKLLVDEKLIKIVAPLILHALSQAADKCGELVCSGARFDKVTLMFFRMSDMTVVVSTDPVPPYMIMKKLEETFHLPSSIVTPDFPCGVQTQKATA